MIICGDALTELRKLPDESVNCCVTSPPYWGLRDYGTAKWEGGDMGCDHIQFKSLKRDTSGGMLPAGEGTRGTQSSTASSCLPYREVCGKCGAVRIDSQLGLERTPEEYVSHLVEVFREVRRVLRKDGTCFIVLGDSYAATTKGTGGTKSLSAGGTLRPHGHSQPSMTPIKQEYGGWPIKSKDLVGIPWSVAFALRADGWWLRQDIIWSKPNPMPESVRDRCTKAHEYIFMLTKSARYWYDAEAVKEGRTTEHEGHQFGGNKYNQANIRIKHSPGSHYKSNGNRNLRSVWTITTKPMPKVFGQEHFATFPPEIPELCIKAGCPKGGTVLDPFFGAGTTGLVALRLGREFVGIELNPAYCEMAQKRIYGTLTEEANV